MDKGYFSVVTDNNPYNPGHKLAHKSYNISTRDTEGILSIARKENIDGVLSFGSDISMSAVAYISEKLGLPGNPSETIIKLTDKGEFRNLLKVTGIQNTEFRIFNENEFMDANEYISKQNLPVIIKPVDSSGSKGVKIIRNSEEINISIMLAYKESFSKRIIVEDFFEKTGVQVCGDGYFENGKIKYIFFGDGHYYNDGLHMAPWGETFPSSYSLIVLNKVETKIESILCAAGFKKGPFNIDVLLNDSECFIIEIGPRSGGNFISRAIKLKYGVDLVQAGVESALDKDWVLETSISEISNFYGCYMIHSPFESGKLINYKISDELVGSACEINNYIDSGNYVYPFLTANMAVANVIFKFNSYKEMISTYADIHSHIKLNLLDEGY